MVHGSQQTSFSSGLSRSAVSGPQTGGGGGGGQNISTQTLDSMDLTDTDVAL